MPSEIQIKCFLEVADKLNFTRAANCLFITQQACSKYISSLESELNFPLFDRSTRKVTLTKDGQILYHSLLNYKVEFDSIIKAGQERQLAKELNINFGLMDGTSPSFFVDSIRKLKEIYPSIQINWHYGEQHEQLSKVQSGELDLAIVFLEAYKKRSGLAWQELFKFHAYLLLASHLTDDDKHIPYDIIANLPFAAHSEFGMDNKSNINSAQTIIRKFNVPHNGIRIYDSLSSALVGVETGESFSITPPIFQHGFYIPYLNKYPLDNTAVVGCVWNPRTTNSKIENIISIITETVKQSEQYKKYSIV